MKIQIINKPVFGKWKDENGKDLDIPSIGIGAGSLSQVLNSLNLPYLFKVKEDLEGLMSNKKKGFDLQEIIKTGKVYGEEFEVFKKMNWKQLKEEEKIKSAYDLLDTYFPAWGAEPNWTCLSFRDLIIISKTSIAEKDRKFDIYKTSEILQVINQWIAYLEKFNVEKQKKEQKPTKKYWQFWK